MSARSRRKFLRQCSTTLFAGYFSSKRSTLAGTSPMERVRVAIIGRTGKGNYGHGVDMAFTQLPNVEIVALADEDDAGRAAASKRTKAARAYADYHEMLDRERPDLVAICPRWVDQHADMIVAAARVGAHVYMEKPFCRTLAECDRAIRELERNDLKLALAHISQYSPVLRVVLSLIQNGEIGEVLELRGRGKEDHRGGGEDLWVLGSHIFGLMRSIAGGNPRSCEAMVLQAGKPVTAADVVEGAEGLGPLAGDQLQARYAFGHQIDGYFASRRGMAGDPSRFALQIFGSKGIIEIPSGYLVPAYILRDGSWSPGRSGKSWETITSNGIGQPETRTDGHYEGGHLAAINDLLDAIDADRPPICSADDGRSIVEMIAAVFESHRLGGPVKLPLETRVNPLTLLS